ncbi:MAG TPA: TIGR03668 family PPOX class F420-dependent oxidoreductase [Candidatus Binataceae bacterium]|jgi:PPOX class probable F420-dependent enzyme
MTPSVQALANPAVRDFIDRARVAHLATASAGGAPHNIPLCFAFDGARFYFAIDQKPKRQNGLMIKRMRNIAENPKVALVIDHYEENWHELAYVLVFGRAAVIAAGAEYQTLLACLRKKYSQYRTMDLEAQRNPIVRIEPESVHVWGSRFEPAGSS